MLPLRLDASKSPSDVQRPVLHARQHVPRNELALLHMWVASENEGLEAHGLINTQLRE